MPDTRSSMTRRTSSAGVARGRFAFSLDDVESYLSGER
jgi:hypothetical protein